MDRRLEGATVAEATAEYLHTTGARVQVHAYRRAIQRFGTGAAFKVKRVSR